MGAYSGISDPSAISTDAGTDGTSDLCIYRSAGGQVAVLTVGQDASLYGGADGTEFTLATVDKAKWNAGQMTLAAVVGSRSFVLQYGPGAKGVTQGLAGNAAQFIASKLKAS
jgi:hypothetical protein